MLPERKILKLRSSQRCPVCDHKGWCGVFEDGKSAICMRVISDKPTKNGGWYHDLDKPLPPRREKETPKRSAPELTIMAKQFESAVNPERLESFADKMGLSVASLRRLGIGYCHDSQAWTFPMRAATGPVVGIRLRANDGAKFSIRGGHEGLFIPDLSGEGTLCLPEGPTSTAALLDMGFDAVGRPSCTGAFAIIRDFLHGNRRDVAIFGDHDSAKPLPNKGVFYPGQDGANRLATELCGVARSVRVIVPPRVKDARDWKKSGATKAVVEAIIRAQRPIRRSA